MKCPNCKETNLVLSERKGIEIDYCPDCRGVWLDRGELDKIIEKSVAEEVKAAPQPASSYSSSHHHSNSYHKPYKRKKSLLEELFD